MKRKYEVRKREDGKMAVFSKTGEQISQWFDEIYFSLRLERMGYFLASQNDQWAIFDLKGNQISDWFDKIDHAGETFYMAKLNGKWYMYDYQGNKIAFNFKKLLLEWFDDFRQLEGDLYLARKDLKFAIFNKKTGEQLSDWYDDIQLLKNDLYIAIDELYDGNPKKAIFDLQTGYRISDWFNYIFMSDDCKYYIGVQNDTWAIYNINGKALSRNFSEEYLRGLKDIRFDIKDINEGILELIYKDGRTYEIKFKPYGEDLLDYTKLLNI